MTTVDYTAILEERADRFKQEVNDILMEKCPDMNRSLLDVITATITLKHIQYEGEMQELVLSAVCRALKISEEGLNEYEQKMEEC